METTLKRKMTANEVMTLFSMSDAINIRYYERIGANTYKITIRHNEDVKPTQLLTKLLKELRKKNKPLKILTTEKNEYFGCYNDERLLLDMFEAYYTGDVSFNFGSNVGKQDQEGNSQGAIYVYYGNGKRDILYIEKAIPHLV